MSGKVEQQGDVRCSRTGRAPAAPLSPRYPIRIESGGPKKAPSAPFSSPPPPRVQCARPVAAERGRQRGVGGHAERERGEECGLERPATLAIRGIRKQEKDFDSGFTPPRKPARSPFPISKPMPAAVMRCTSCFRGLNEGGRAREAAGSASAISGRGGFFFLLSLSPAFSWLDHSPPSLPAAAPLQSPFSAASRTEAVLPCRRWRERPWWWRGWS